MKSLVGRMDASKQARWAACGLSACLLGIFGCGEDEALVALGPEPATRGVVVEEVGAGSALEKAGLEARDIVLSWRRLANPPANPEAAQGELVSPFDWMWLELEQAPRGTVELSGRRGGDERVFRVAPGLWDAEVRPRIPEGLVEDYLRGRERLEAGEIAKAARWWEKIAAGGDRLLRCWILLRIGEVWAEQQEWKKAHAAYRSALEKTPQPWPQAVLSQAIGKGFEAQSKLELALQAYGSARKIRETAWGNETLALAESLNSLGEVTYTRGELDRATEYFQQVLAIQRKLAPDSLMVAVALNNLGAVADDHGYLDRATDFYQRALEIEQQLAPDGLNSAYFLNNLGLVAWRRGDLDGATEDLERALEILRRLAPDKTHVANILNNLGLVAQDRRDLERAGDLYQRALEIWQELAPVSVHEARCLGNLGTVARHYGNLDRARDFHQRGLKILENLAPDSLDVANSLNNLGKVATADENLEQARDLHQQALEIRQKLAPNSLEVAFSLSYLGKTLSALGDPDRAEEFHQRALEIRQELVPESVQVAETLHALGLLHLQRNPSRPAIADDLFRRALDSLENQVARLGGSHDVQAGFRAQYDEYYHDALEVQLELEEPGVAFSTLERSRARTFLEQFAERDIVFSTDIPEELDRQRRRFRVRFDRTQRQLAELNSRDHAAQIGQLHDQLRRLRDEARDVERKIRRTAPRLADLQYPQPLDLVAARGALDPGTLMLSYSVGKESSVLFAVSKQHGLQVERLAVGGKTLGDAVEALARLTRDVSLAGDSRMRGLEEYARNLYTALIEPVADRIEASERILILADGPLHYLPWGALRRDTAAGGAQYLVEWKPLHLALSATVYAELRSRRRRDRQNLSPGRIAAFGDPRYPGSPEDVALHGEVDLRSVAEHGIFDWPPLPHTRREVEGIAGAFPAEHVRVYLGAAATEENAKSIGRDVSIVHFATHGHLDQRFPLNSFLALTIPEDSDEAGDNGLLQVWEIFEQLRIEAELVVLSACRSGVGAEQGGEGLIGLTRAFQYAGARSIAATLWDVADQTTAELMIRFYQHLKAGKSKDEALRAAQIELIREPIAGKDASAPYYWAAFQLYGDWQ